MKKLKKLDDLTVVVPMTSPYGSFVDQLSYWYYLYIVPDGYDPKKPPTGTGPFVYESFTPASRASSPATRTTGRRAFPTSTR